MPGRNIQKQLDDLYKYYEARTYDLGPAQPQGGRRMRRPAARAKPRRKTVGGGNAWTDYVKYFYKQVQYNMMCKNTKRGEDYILPSRQEVMDEIRRMYWKDKGEPKPRARKPRARKPRM